MPERPSRSFIPGKRDSQAKVLMTPPRNPADRRSRCEEGASRCALEQKSRVHLNCRLKGGLGQNAPGRQHNRARSLSRRASNGVAAAAAQGSPRQRVSVVLPPRGILPQPPFEAPIQRDLAHVRPGRAFCPSHLLETRPDASLLLAWPHRQSDNVCSGCSGFEQLCRRAEKGRSPMPPRAFNIFLYTGDQIP